MTGNPIVNVLTLEDLNRRLPIDFPSGVFPLLEQMNDWKEWADRVVSSGAFGSLDAPISASYKTSEEWLTAFKQVVVVGA